MNAANTVKNLVLFASKNPKHVKDELVQVVKDLDYKILPANIGAFKSAERFCELYPQRQELFVQNKAEIEGAHVHVLINMPGKPDTMFFDAINTVTTHKDYNPASIHVIMPFAPFARQDRPFDKRFVSQAAKLLPKHLKVAGADHITTFDVHSKAAEQCYIAEFGAENVQFLSAVELIHDAVKSVTNSDDVVKYGGPDGGDKPNDVAQTKARMITQRAYGADCDLADHMFYITKRHEGVNKTKVMKMDGTVDGSVAVELDDMGDTGGTLVNGAEALKAKGATKVIAAFTHPIVSGNSLSRLTSDTIDGKPNAIDFLITTDSIVSVHNKVKRLTEDQQKRVKVISTAPLIKQAMAYRF